MHIIYGPWAPNTVSNLASSRYDLISNIDSSITCTVDLPMPNASSLVFSGEFELLAYMTVASRKTRTVGNAAAGGSTLAVHSVSAVGALTL